MSCAVRAAAVWPGAGRLVEIADDLPDEIDEIRHAGMAGDFVGRIKGVGTAGVAEAQRG